MAENLVIKHGNKGSLPSEKEKGTIYFTWDSEDKNHGKIYYDVPNEDETISRADVSGCGYDMGNGAEIFNSYSGEDKNVAEGDYSHAEGVKTKALGIGSHVEGSNTIAEGPHTHAEGTKTKAISATLAPGSHAEGWATVAENGGHAEGVGPIAIGPGTHAEGVSGVDATLAIFGQSLVAYNQLYDENKNLKSNDEIIALWKDNIVPGEDDDGNIVDYLGAFSLAKGTASHTEGYSNLALADFSHSEGKFSLAQGIGSHAEGRETIASGVSSHAEGQKTIASGDQSHAEGYQGHSYGEASHVEGASTNLAKDFIYNPNNNNALYDDDIINSKWEENKFTLAKGQASHVEGKDTLALGNYSHAEGYQTQAEEIGSHAEGGLTEASGNYSHAEGYGTKASGNYSHAGGYRTIASNDAQTAIGKYNIKDDSGTYLFIVGNGTDTSTRSNAFTIDKDGNVKLKGNIYANDSKILPTKEYLDNNFAKLNVSNTFDGEQKFVHSTYCPWDKDKSDTASGIGCAFKATRGFFNQLLADEIYIPKKTGSLTIKSYQSADNNGQMSGAIRDLVTITGGEIHSFSFGRGCSADGEDSFASGQNSQAINKRAHAEGWGTLAAGEDTHTEGNSTYASVVGAHAEGIGDKDSRTSYGAQARAAHAEGELTLASGEASHAEGRGCKATGKYSHAAGHFTQAAGTAQTVVGRYNQGRSDDASGPDSFFIVGVGTSASAKSNGFRVDRYGKCLSKDGFEVQLNTADFAEYFEWEDQNILNEDRRGLFVTLDNNKIRLANLNDNYILGAISTTGAFIGNSGSEEWKDRFVKNIFEEIQYEDVVVSTEEILDNGEVIVKETIEKHPILNPDYNPEEEYIPRSERPEWGVVGLCGQVIVVDDGTCEVNGYCRPYVDGIASSFTIDDIDENIPDFMKEFYLTTKGFRVMERLDENHIKVLIK